MKENITKANIVKEVAARTGLNQKDVFQVFESIIDVTKESLENGNSIQIRGFGSFLIKHRAKKLARNITKNTTIVIPAHNVPAFKPSKEFVDLIRNK